MKNRRFYLAVLGMIGVILLFAEFYGCKIAGKEFSPDDFTARSFSYRRSPFSGTLRSGRINEFYDVDNFSIVNDGHVKIVNSNPKKWDLFRENMQVGDRLSGEFDARFLTHFFNYNSEQWTVAYPKKAAILWPEVATMAREGLYIYLPEVMRAGIPEDYEEESERSIPEFRSEIGQKLADAYRMAAKVSKVNKDGKEVQWKSAAKKYDVWAAGNFVEKTDGEKITAEKEEP